MSIVNTYGILSLPDSAPTGTGGECIINSLMNLAQESFKDSSNNILTGRVVKRLTDYHETIENPSEQSSNVLTIPVNYTCPILLVELTCVFHNECDPSEVRGGKIMLTIKESCNTPSIVQIEDIYTIDTTGCSGSFNSIKGDISVTYDSSTGHILLMFDPSHRCGSYLSGVVKAEWMRF